MQSLPLYTSCLFTLLLNDDFLDIGDNDGIRLLPCIVDSLLGLFLYSSIILLYIQDLRN